MNIEVGEWVRTKDGYLGKLIAINKQDYNYLVIDTSKNIRNDEYPATYLYLKNANIAKHSKNIIDLIEVGDIVEVLVNKRTNEILRYTLDTESDLYLLRKESIKTILTHEQYSKNAYRLEEE